jgi:aerobic-type carbon monoxide dehydrogenase small subunit (CoxS/CutS family)
VRVTRHPILPEDAPPDVTIFFNGKPIPAKSGEPIAAALLASGLRVFRETAKKRRPRGIFCGIGRCTDCVMVVDGQPNVRTCVTPVRQGMKVEIQKGPGVWKAE